MSQSSGAPEVSTAELRRLRLSAQLLVRSASAPRSASGTTPLSVVQGLLALQAQDFGQGVHAIGVRTAGGTRAEVLAALDRGEIVRSWPMRGTLHFVAPGDLRWLLALTWPRIRSGLALRYRQLELTDETIDRAADVASSLLSGGRSLGRADFLLALEGAGIDTGGQRAPHLIGDLAQRGLLCWGPTHGTQQALVLLGEWAPPGPVPSRDDSLRELALRYFRGHGPATVADLAWWAKLPLGDVRRGLEAALADPGASVPLVEVVHGGIPHWMGADTIAAPESTRMLLLPGFDEYLLGYRDRSPILDAEFQARIVPGMNGIFLPTILYRGRIVGTWRRAATASGVRVTPEPFEKRTAARDAATRRAIGEYGRYAGSPVVG